MANVNHSTLTDPYLHEPKGVASAGAGTVYVANGSGSGTWVEKTRFIGAYVGFDATTPAYAHSVTTADTILNPTFTVAESNGFTGETSPNARLKYTGSEDIDAQIVFTISSSQAHGTNHDVEFAIFKNGTELGGSRAIRTISSGSWGSISVFGYTSFSTNDYLEVKVKGGASFTMNVASAFMSIMGSAS
jgi:hypothetical protein